MAAFSFSIYIGMFIQPSTGTFYTASVFLGIAAASKFFLHSVTCPVSSQGLLGFKQSGRDSESTSRLSWGLGQDPESSFGNAQRYSVLHAIMRICLAVSRCVFLVLVEGPGLRQSSPDLLWACRTNCAVFWVQALMFPFLKKLVSSGYGCKETYECWHACVQNAKFGDIIN